MTCIPGLSPHGATVLIRFELCRRGPGTTAQALRLWIDALDDPGHRLYDLSDGSDCWGGCAFWAGDDCGDCYTDPWEVRSYLEAAAHALPNQDARRFRAMLARLDEHW